MNASSHMLYVFLKLYATSKFQSGHVNRMHFKTVSKDQIGTVRVALFLADWLLKRIMLGGMEFKAFVSYGFLWFCGAHNGWHTE